MDELLLIKRSLKSDCEAAREVRPITRPIARFPIPRLLTLSSQVSDHGVELQPFRIRSLGLATNLSRAVFSTH